MRVYQATVQIGAAHPCYCSVTLREGDQILVDGEPMVRTAGNVIEPAATWHDSAADAYLNAAERVRLVVSQLFEAVDAIKAKARAMQSAGGGHE